MKFSSTFAESNIFFHYEVRGIINGLLILLKFSTKTNLDDRLFFHDNSHPIDVRQLPEQCKRGFKTAQIKGMHLLPGDLDYKYIRKNWPFVPI